MMSIPSRIFMCISFLVFSLPDWANYVWHKYKNVLEFFVAISFESSTRTTEMKKMKCGPLIREMLQRFRRKALGLLDPNLRIYNYFGHEGTIIHTLSCLGVYQVIYIWFIVLLWTSYLSLTLISQFDMPSFGACLLFEMYERDSKYFVRLSYKTDDSKYPSPMSFPGCGTMCPLNTLIEMYRPIMPNGHETYNSICGN